MKRKNSPSSPNFKSWNIFQRKFHHRLKPWDFLELYLWEDVSQTRISAFENEDKVLHGWTSCNVVQLEFPKHLRDVSAQKSFPCELFVSDWGCEIPCLPSVWQGGAARHVLHACSPLPVLLQVGPVTVHPKAAGGESCSCSQGHEPALLHSASRGKSAQEENHRLFLVKWILQPSYLF